MINTTAKEFLESEGIIDPSSYDKLIIILDKYAELKIKESKHVAPLDTFTIEVKNIDCDFEFLRDGLDKICARFTIDKDTFIFHSVDMPLYVKLIKFRDALKENNNNILVTKEGF